MLYRLAQRLTENAAMDIEQRQIAEAARQACIAAALAAYEDAGVMGLCAEGRWEAAVGAMQSLDLKQSLHLPHIAAHPGLSEPPV
jgi:hypothetical protein